jgi:hypothetical protein
LQNNLNQKKMKKILSIVALMAIGLVNAQDFKSKRGEYMLPEKGDWALEFGAGSIFKYLGNAFNGNLNNNAPEVDYSNNYNGLFVGKYFNTDKSAYRVVFNFASVGRGTKISTTSADNTVVIVPGAPAPNSVLTTSNQTETKNSNTEFAIGVGKEWRRGKTRLQGFYGADVLLLFSGSSSSSNSNTENLTNVVTPAQTIKSIVLTDSNTKGGSGFGIGAQGFIGAEYFLFPKMAIGAQYTYGVRYISTGEGNTTIVTTNSTDNSLPTPTFNSTVTTTVTKVPSSYNRGFTGVGLASINLTLHF